MKKMIPWVITITMCIVPYYSGHLATSVRVTHSVTVEKKASFEEAYGRVRKWECNWSNHSRDIGGETYGGVSRRYFPDWLGWQEVDKFRDSLRRKGKHMKWNVSIPGAEPYVVAFYLDIWITEGFRNLNNQDVANWLFDYRLLFQQKRTINSLNKVSGLDLPTGRQEWVSKQINSFSTLEIIPGMKNIRDQYHYARVSQRPDQRVFLRGWLNRSNDLSNLN